MGLLLGALLLGSLSGGENFSVDSISASGFRTWDDPVGDSIRRRVKNALSNVSYNESAFFDSVNKMGDIPDHIEVYQSRIYEIEKTYKV